MNARIKNAIADGVTPYWAHECYSYTHVPHAPMTNEDVRRALLAAGYSPERVDELVR